ncbi:hypothetical protein AB0L55_37455 [Streptomyces anthocyanicus]|uniref:hypothetical protein n=1 Tax=Streptomyces anthocyanicus TaxID=68174 RepID=UPI00344526B0
MTDQPQPPMPSMPPQPERQPEPPTAPAAPAAPAAVPASAEKKRPGNKVIIAATAAIIAAIVGTGIVVIQIVNNDGDDKPAAAATETSTPAEDPATTVADEPDPEPTFTTPTADDFTIELRTTSRQCFGSAGCNLTVEPTLSYTGLTDDLDPDAVYQITYEIKGDESGPILKTAELSDQTTLNYTPTSLSTKSSGTKLSVEITDITETGI